MITLQDKELLAKKGISEEQIAEQLACFEKGFPYLKLSAAASVEQGILAPDADEQKKYLNAWEAYTQTDKTVMFSVDDASVNGFMADPFYATSVSAGKCAFSSMAWSDTTLEENGITEVEEIEVLFRAYDADDFMGEDFANEVITLNP